MHITRQTRQLALALGVTAVLVAGCGSGDKGSDAAATDKAFVGEMVPHHQMAVEMAKMAQGQARRPQIKALADNITRSQNAEIMQMTAIAATLDVKPNGMENTNMSRMEEDGKTLGVRPMEKMGMDMEMDTLDGAKPFDRVFIDMMVPQHQGAIRMARGVLAKGRNGKLRKLATHIIAGQEKEIRQMNGWRANWYGKP